MKNRRPVVSSEVHFHFLKAATLRRRTELKQFLTSLVQKETGKAALLSFVFCSDEELLKMNRQFLQHDYFTDILSFPLDPVKNAIHGEMYISIDRVRDNARALGLRSELELHRVIFHGTLHLCGYRDKTPAQIREIRSKEDACLKRYFG